MNILFYTTNEVAPQYGGVERVTANIANALTTFYNVNCYSAYKYEGGNLAASKIRNLECPSYEICLIDYGCGKFNRKIHIMEQYP